MFSVVPVLKNRRGSVFVSFFTVLQEIKRRLPKGFKLLSVQFPGETGSIFVYISYDSDDEDIKDPAVVKKEVKDLLNMFGFSNIYIVMLTSEAVKEVWYANDEMIRGITGAFIGTAIFAVLRSFDIFTLFETAFVAALGFWLGYVFRLR